MAKGERTTSGSWDELLRDLLLRGTLGFWATIVLTTILSVAALGMWGFLPIASFLAIEKYGDLITNGLDLISFLMVTPEIVRVIAPAAGKVIGFAISGLVATVIVHAHNRNYPARVWLPLVYLGDPGRRHSCHYKWGLDGERPVWRGAGAHS